MHIYVGHHTATFHSDMILNDIALRFFEERRPNKIKKTNKQYEISS